MNSEERKQNLLEELRGARREWDALLAQMTETDMLVSGVEGDWSIKDIAAHLMFWEARTVKWLDAARNGTSPEPSPVPKGLSEDEENAWIYARYRDNALNEVMNEARAIHEAVVERVAEMTAPELCEQKFEWLGSNTLAASLPGNSYEHYRDHNATVRAWWQSRKKA